MGTIISKNVKVTNTTTLLQMQTAKEIQSDIQCQEHQIQVPVCLVSCNNSMMDNYPYISDNKELIVKWYRKMLSKNFLKKKIPGFELKSISFKVDGLENYFVITFYTDLDWECEDNIYFKYVADPDYDGIYTIYARNFGECLVLGCDSNSILR